MSFSVKISAKDRATGRFMSRVHRALIKAVNQAKADKQISQAQIAEAMGVDKSVVSRILNGEGNLTLKTIGDISWAVGLRPEFRFEKIAPIVDVTSNHPAMAAPAFVPELHSMRETTKPVEFPVGEPAASTTGVRKIRWQMPSTWTTHAH